MAGPSYIIVGTGEQIGMARELIKEYADSLGCSPCLRNIESEMRNFPHPFAAPEGGLLLAIEDGESAGVVGIKKIGDGMAEMARLYVRPEFRGRNLGRELAAASIILTRKLGYKALRLYTLPDMAVALNLYRKLGFKEIEPYGDHPIPEAYYLEKEILEV